MPKKLKAKPASERTEPKSETLYDTLSPIQRAEETFRQSVKVPAGANDYVSRFLEIVKLIRSETPSNGSFTIHDFFVKNRMFEIPNAELIRLYDEWTGTMLRFAKVCEVPSINSLCGLESQYVFV